MSHLPRVHRRRIESATFLTLVILTSALFFWMIRAFVWPVFWAAILAVLFHGIHARLLAVCRDRATPAALLSVFAVVIFVVLPFVLVAGAIARQGLLLYRGIAAGEISVQGPINMLERSLPAVAGFLGRYGVDLDQLRVSAQDLAAAATQIVATRALGVGQDALWVTALFALMLYLLFFFFRDGDRIVAGMAGAVPLGDERRSRLLLKFTQVVRATVKGNLIVAVAQGGLLAALFWFVGIQTALFWGVVTAVLSLLPAVGASFVWVPGAIIMLATGQVWQGLVVLLGGVAITAAENVLRPIVIGRDTNMSDYLILVSTLGGIMVFGLAGFVAGPVLAALFLVLWDLFAEEYVRSGPDAPPDTEAPPPPPRAAGVR
ncbi:MAG TPA: AI-2E family transporter [Longimicrobiales bacterium]|nr:AI-2E family transporter [Longimicrobiales bacterium]